MIEKYRICFCRVNEKSANLETVIPYDTSKQNIDESEQLEREFYKLFNRKSFLFKRAIRIPAPFDYRAGIIERDLSGGDQRED